MNLQLGYLVQVSTTMNGHKTTTTQAEGAAAGIDLLVGNTTEEAKIFLSDVPEFTSETIERSLNDLMGAVGRSGPDAHAAYRQSRPGGSRSSSRSQIVFKCQFHEERRVFYG